MSDKPDRPFWRKACVLTPWAAMWWLQSFNSTLPPDWITVNTRSAPVYFAYWWSFPWFATQAGIYAACIALVLWAWGAFD